MSLRSALLLLSLLLPLAARAEVQVVASIKPLQLIASAILESSDRVEALIPAGQSPHHYNLKPSDRLQLESADLVIWVGPSLETFLVSLMGQISADREVLELQQQTGIRILNLRHEGDERGNTVQEQVDSHLWLDPQNARRIAQLLTERLAALNPSGEKQYRSNLNRFLLQLNSLDTSIAAQLQEVSERPYIVYHDAFQYLETHYGIQHALALVADPEIAPGMRSIIQTRKAVMDSTAQCLFTENSANPAIIATLLANKKVRQVHLDILGSEQVVGADGYINMLQGIAAAIHSCLMEGGQQ